MGLLALAGCEPPWRSRGEGSDAPTSASGGAGSGSASASASGSAGASGGSGQSVTRTVTTVGASLEVTVGPAVVSDDVMVVPLAVHLDTTGSSSRSDNGKRIDINVVRNGTGNFSGADGARVVDFDAGTVQETFKATSDLVGLTDKESDATLHALFKPVDADTIDVLVPESGLFEGVPVVRDGKLSVEAKEAVGRAKDTEDSPDPVALETFTASVGGLGHAGGGQVGGHQPGLRRPVRLGLGRPERPGGRHRLRHRPRPRPDAALPGRRRAVRRSRLRDDHSRHARHRR